MALAEIFPAILRILWQALGFIWAGTLTFDLFKQGAPDNLAKTAANLTKTAADVSGTDFGGIIMLVGAALVIFEFI